MRQQVVGPYRLEERLGVGGMGEVFRAWDERLERWVALKQVRPGLELDDPRRQRLRREARIAASLIHPNLVAIHDLVETPTGDWIVMELVEGETLEQRLRRGSVEVEQGLAWARQVASGLAAAHMAGILHRDLKTANVMIDAQGSARILDFGVAKRIPSGERSNTSTGPDDGLTDPGQVLGTARTMSPEQSRGEPLDPRSDLFSLGAMLYETFCGDAPFAADDPHHAVRRVRGYQPQPAHQRRPGIPRPLSGLIEQLLEKEPTRRPASASEVETRLRRMLDQTPDSLEALSTQIEPVDSAPAEGVEGKRPRAANGRRSIWRGVALVALGLLGVLGWGGWESKTLHYVVVADPLAARPGPEADTSEVSPLVLASVRSALFEGLLSLEGLAPLTTQGVAPNTSIPSLARATAADEVLTSEVACRGGSCRVELRRLRGLDGRVVWADSLEGPEDDLRLLATAVGERLAQGWPGHRNRREQARAIPSAEAYDTLLRLRVDHQQQNAEPDQLLEALEALRQRAPAFVEVYRLEAKVAHDRYFDRREPRDLGRAFAVLEQALALAPDDIQTHEQRFSIALDRERLDIAQESLDALRRLAPGDARSQRREALLLERQGATAEALETLRQSAERHSSVSTLFELASMEYRQGKTDAARETLEQLLDRAPGSYNARSFLAQLELLEGSLTQAIVHYRELLEHRVGIAELSNLGLAHLLLGETAEAAGLFQQALEWAPDNPMLALNLADAQFLAGEVEPAHALYREVIARLPEEVESNWQELSVGAQALAHLGEHRQAIERLQRALRLAPENPQVAYEAALVYTVIGEPTSALVQAERALQSFDTRWFDLPWFDTLRGDLERLAVGSEPTSDRNRRQAVDD